MNFNLLTREEALNITNTTEVFYVSKRNVNGFDVEMYDYRLASYTDFFPENEKNRTEMRGLTFIFNKEKNKWERHIAMNKFFNVNQTTQWEYDDLKNKKIVALADKRDGSLILPVILPNGDVVMKTKMSFESPQADGAYEIYKNNQNYKDFIDYCEKNNIQTIWEYTSFDNQIVLSYSNKELFLLQARYKNTGEYICSDRLLTLSKKYNIPITEQYNIPLIKKIISFYTKEDIETFLVDKKFNTLKDMISILDKNILSEVDTFYYENKKGHIELLDFLLLSRNYIEKEEGVVITFEDGQMAKIKHMKYLQLHGLTTEATRENLLIETILNDHIDDVIAQLQNGDKKDFILDITKKVTKKFNHSVVEIKNIIKEYNGDRKEFALQYKNHELFSICMKVIQNPSEKYIEEKLKEYFINKTRSLKNAQEWIGNIENE